MNINIKKQKRIIKEERKLKLLKLKNGIDIPQLGYNWKITSENEEEFKTRIEDLHLFCISITKNILRNTFYTNEDGIMKYEHNIETDKTIENLDILFKIIEKQRNKNINGT